MAKTENLIPSTKGGYQLTNADRKKGARKSVKVRREQKKFKELFRIILDKKLQADSDVDLVENIESIAELQGKNITGKDAIAIAMLKRAIEGDVRAFEMIWNVIGENPNSGDTNINIAPVVITGKDDILD